MRRCASSPVDRLVRSRQCSDDPWAGVRDGVAREEPIKHLFHITAHVHLPLGLHFPLGLPTLGPALSGRIVRPVQPAWRSTFPPANHLPIGEYRTLPKAANPHTFWLSGRCSCEASYRILEYTEGVKRAGPPPGLKADFCRPPCLPSEPTC